MLSTTRYCSPEESAGRQDAEWLPLIADEQALLLEGQQLIANALSALEQLLVEEDPQQRCLSGKLCEVQVKRVRHVLLLQSAMHC